MDRLQSMRVFQRVIDEGGFAAAARAMDMSPAGVTRLVGDLEQHLGVRLIQRSTRRLALTEAGEAYLLRVRSILHEVEDAEAAATASTRELQGNLRILATQVLATYFLAPSLACWRERYPKVGLELAVDPFPLARVDEFDVIFMAVENGFDASVVARPLVSTESIVCASPAYLQRAGTPLEPQDLQEHAYLRFPWRDGASQGLRHLRLRPLEEGGAAVEVDMPVVLQSSSFDVIFRAALDGAGVAMLPRQLIAPQLTSGALVHLLPDWIFGRYTTYAVLPTRKLVPARTRAFLDFLTETVAGQSHSGARPRTP